MNAILSIIVCFAMLFSGGATLPAQPETATVRTLRNLSVTTDEGSVTLNPELRLTTAIGTESARMQFEIVNGDDVLLPIAGEITPDCLRFTMGNSGSVYTLTSEAMMALLEEEGDAEENEQMMQALEYMGEYVASYTALMNRSMRDADFRAQLAVLGFDLLADTCGATPEQTTVEIDGQQVPAERIHLELNPTASFDLMEAMASCGVPEIEDMMGVYAQMFGAIMGEEYDSASDFVAAMRAEIPVDADLADASYPMDAVYTRGVEPLYMEIQMDAPLDETASIQLHVVEIATGEEARASANMTLTFAENGADMQMDFAMDAQQVGPMNDPQSVDLHAELCVKNSWIINATDSTDSSLDYVSTDRRSLVMNLSAAVDDGLESGTLDLFAGIESSFGYSGETPDCVSSDLTVHITSDDRREDDGSVTSAVVIDLECDGEAGVISYELNCLEGAPVPEFDESKSVDLMGILEGDLMGTLEGDELSPAMLSFVSDASALSADAVALSTEESVAAMVELLKPEELFVEMEESNSYDSLEAAAEVYQGGLFDFELPEDMVVDSISAGDTYLSAYYCSEADDGRSASLYFGAGYGDSSYYAYQDGGLKPAEGVAQVQIADEESGSYIVNASKDDEDCSFYLYGFSPEEVDVLLASLEF